MNNTESRYNNMKIGGKFGEWTVIENPFSTKRNGRTVKCQCSCGLIKNITCRYLSSAKHPRCRECHLKDRVLKVKIGDKFGDWTVIESVFIFKGKSSVLCECKCGTRKVINPYTIINGQSRCCRDCGNKRGGDSNREKTKSKVLDKARKLGIKITGFKTETGVLSKKVRVFFECSLCKRVFSVSSSYFLCTKKTPSCTYCSQNFVQNKIKTKISEIKSFFIHDKFPYTTSGKEEVTNIVCDALPFYGVEQASMLTLPHYGREIKRFHQNGLIDIASSTGLEYDRRNFLLIRRALSKFFPSLEIKNEEIHKYIIETEKHFDFAHIDLNGPIIDRQSTGLSTPESIEKLLDKGSIVQVTFQDNFRYFTQKENERRVDMMREFNVEIEECYRGIRGCRMRSMLIVP